MADIEEIETEVARRARPLGKRVNVVNDDHFSIRPDLMDAYAAMVQRLTERYYACVSRHAASGLVKARLEGAAHERPTVGPQRLPKPGGVPLQPGAE